MAKHMTEYEIQCEVCGKEIATFMRSAAIKFEKIHKALHQKK